MSIFFLSNVAVPVPQAQIHDPAQIPQFPQPVVAVQEIPAEASRAYQFNERIQARRNQLEQKRNSILVELASESLRPDKEEFFISNVQRIEVKLQFLVSRCEEQNQKRECKRDKRFPKHGLAGQPGPWGRGNRGGRECTGRGGRECAGRGERECTGRGERECAGRGPRGERECTGRGPKGGRECAGRGPRGERECTGRGRHHDEDPVLFSLTEEARPRIMEARRNGDEAAVVAIQMEIMDKFQQHMSSKSQSS